MVRVCTFSKVLPFDGIPHAGGEYYCAHVRALKRLGHEILVVAPREDRNLRARERTFLREDEYLLVDFRRKQRLGLIGTLLDRTRSTLRGVSPGEPYLRQLRIDDRVLAAVERCEIVEFQWEENFPIARVLRGRLSTKPSLGIAHDVLSQKYWRELESARILAKVRPMLKFVGASCFERFGFGRLTMYGFLSEKDRELATAKLSNLEDRNLRVFSPPLTPGRIHVESSVTTDTVRNVLFVGAFNRIENEDAALHLMTDIWPAVSRVDREASLRVVGAEPTQKMHDAAARCHNVVVTGYVEDISSEYSTADVAIVPLRSGAGVKFKTIHAMLNRLPVVSTSIGAEGIGTQAMYACVSDSADGLATALLDVLSNRQKYSGNVQAAYEYAVAASSPTDFLAQLDSAFKALQSVSETV